MFDCHLAEFMEWLIQNSHILPIIKLFEVKKMYLQKYELFASQTFREENDYVFI